MAPTKLEKLNDYDAFVEKFKPKHTTDDCFTPDNVYEVVADYVNAKYDVSRSDMVRPFWPGGDFENFEYPDGCVVVDNPPFSILSKIIDFYIGHNIRFFMFAPSLTLPTRKCCGVIANAKIIYENGANINTSFVTNLDERLMFTEPVLYNKLYEIQNMKPTKKQYKYPMNVVTPAILGIYATHGIEFELWRNQAVHIARCELHPEHKDIFGYGYLINNEKAVERINNEKAVERINNEKAVERIKLSEHELDLIKVLDAASS